MAGADPVMDRLAKYVHPLTLEPDNETVPDELADVLEGARIVGLGEATHGTAEFTRLQRVVLEYMVTKQGCRLLGLETNYSETLALDAYVVGDGGSPEAALDRLQSWPWKIEELRDLLEWLRTFNADRPVSDRVRVRGFDAQYVEEPASAIREFLAGVDPEFLEAVADGLDALSDESIRGDRYNVAEEHVRTAQETVEKLVDRFEMRSEEYADCCSQEDVDRARWHLRTMEGAIAFASESYETDAPHGAVNRRDRVMAQHVRRLATAAPGPVVLWGHNGHLLPGKTIVDDGFVPMGQHLAEWFDEDYRVIATDFNHGSFTATPDPLEVEKAQPTTFTVGPFHEDPPYEDKEWAPERTVNGALADSGAEVCYLDVTRAEADAALTDWLAQRHPVRDVGIAFWDEAHHLTGYQLPEEMEGLLFVTESTPTTLLDKSVRNDE